MRKSSHDRPSATVLEKPTPVDDSVRVAYPRESEIIEGFSYTIQVATIGQAVRVEVSIDHDAWQPCRESMGLWWFDWSGDSDGPHEVIARMHCDGGLITLSKPVQFVVNKT